jgi:TonB family protein
LTAPRRRPAAALRAVAALLAALPGAAAAAAALPGPAGAADTALTTAAPDSSAVAYTARVRVDEPGFDGKLTLEVYHEPGWFPVPEAAGELVLVHALDGEGTHAFFIASDLAFEMGSTHVHRVAQEEASDLLGQALGGRLRPGEAQLGFALVPHAAGLGEWLAVSPDSVSVRYAHHRGRWRRASPEEMDSWHTAFERQLLAAALNLWWEWRVETGKAPEMSEGEKTFFAEMLLPGQGGLLAEEGVSHEALRNAILRFGERRLQEGAARRRVAPAYPAPARQLGVGGLVIVLAYVSQEGKVEDATILASTTAHMLNLAALSAATEWEFTVLAGPSGEALDGWRLLPFQFKLAEAEVPPALPDSVLAPVAMVVPPRILRAVEPRYPETARQRGLAGTVIYRVGVDARGKLARADLVQGVDPVLDQEALAALERTLFEPATRNGLPVPGEITVPFTFGKKRR